MSKWINKDLFNKFQEGKKKEIDTQPKGLRRSDLVWKTPEKGTPERAKVYEGRFLTDKNGTFYKKFYYHMFQSGESWVFVLCNKTFNFENFCPFCTSTSKLYTGSAADKKMAANYKRKEKFVGNFYIVDDPRDADTDEDYKVSKKVRLYEFPGKVEMKLKEEITDTKNGLGPYIFDPGEEGYNFILKVLSTKRDKNNKIWPDYSSSTFSRRSSSLGSDDEINKIMESIIDIDEYLNDMKKTDDEILEIIKSEMLWDLVKDDYEKYNRMRGVTGTDAPTTTPDEDTRDNDTGDDSPFVDDTGDEDLSDAALLKELEDL